MNAAAAALVVLNGRQAFDPRASLFAHNEPGFWYDPSDLSSMYQDSAGTTPVTAVEQAVGLVLDKSRGYVLGGDLAVNGAFAADSDWTKGTGWSIGSGVATKTAGSAAALSQTITSTTGRAYLISATITRTAGTLTVSIGTSGTSAAFTASYTGTFVVFAGSSTQTLSFSGDASFAGTVDNVIVRELAGNHAIQPGATNRPILRSRYNLLTYSEQFDNAAWSKTAAGTGLAPVVTPNAAIAPDGTTTADSIVFDRGAGNAIGDQSRLSQTPTLTSATYTQYVWLKAATAGDVGKQIALRNAAGVGYGVVTLTADWVRYTRTETGSSANWEMTTRGTITSDNTVTVLVWGADLRSANDTYLPYQRIAAATDYDVVGFPVYLAFDGSDDSLYTGGNLVPGTDKVQIFAGITKLSDAAQGVFAELSATIASNNGTFLLAAPDAADATFGWDSKGTAQVDAVASTVAAPRTAVLAGIGDIGGDNAVLYVDNVAADTDTGDQGTGDYGSYPLYIGRRNNTSAPFNGRMFGLIGRFGPNLSDALRTQAARWMAAKQGRTL